MAVTTTPLGFKKPDGNELVRGGDNVIADNAQKTQDLIADLQSRSPFSGFDGGSPTTVYASEQIVDGGTV